MYAFVNTLAHKFNIYPLLQNGVYLFNRTFIKKTNYPIISILLFIIVVILNSIQYANNNHYLQSKIINYRDYDTKKIDMESGVNIYNIFIYIYYLIGINGFINNTPVYIFYFIATYFFVSLIELNIGHAKLLFLLFICLIFTHFWITFRRSICENNIYPILIFQDNFWFSSNILQISLGFILCLLLKNIRNIYASIFTICLMILIFLGSVLYDYFKNSGDSNTDSVKNCNIITLHGCFFIFGIICSLSLGN
jgi:hypothetical protein